MILALTFIFGTILGSFLNVVILRHNSGMTTGGRSMCFSCGKTLHWHELLPVVSYIMLRGKCSQCKSGISLQYPVVEIVTGLVYMCIGWYLSPLLATMPLMFVTKFAYYAYLFSLLVVLSVYDWRHKIIPDDFVYLFTIMSFVLLFFETGGAFSLHVPTLSQVLAGPVLALPFAGLWFISKGRWIGFGDAKLALGMGFLLGMGGGLAAVLIAFWIGAIVGVVLLLLKKYGFTMKSEIPFAPFLVLGTLVSFFLGLNWIALIS